MSMQYARVPLSGTNISFSVETLLLIYHISQALLQKNYSKPPLYQVTVSVNFAIPQCGCDYDPESLPYVKMSLKKKIKEKFYYQFFDIINSHQSDNSISTSQRLIHMQNKNFELLVQL